jgi:hypothetical protein
MTRGALELCRAHGTVCAPSGRCEACAVQCEIDALRADAEAVGSHTATVLADAAQAELDRGDVITAGLYLRAAGR